MGGSKTSVVTCDQGAGRANGGRVKTGRQPITIQLWRAEDDAVLPHPFYAEAVRAALPKPVDYREVPKAGHYDFLAPCTPRFAGMAPPLCNSLPGFDRVAFHREFNAAVVSFFGAALRP